MQNESQKEIKQAVSNTADLQKMLLATVDDVREGRINWQTALTIASLSSVVLNSAKLDLEYLKFSEKQTGRHDPNSKVLPLVEHATVIDSE